MKTYIYIFSHPKFEGWIKIGKTWNVNKRLRAYQTCCPDRAFTLDYFIETQHVDEIERYFKWLFLLSGTKHKDNSLGYEWFKCSKEEAISIIEKQLELIKQHEKEIIVKYPPKNKFQHSTKTYKKHPSKPNPFKKSQFYYYVKNTIINDEYSYLDKEKEFKNIKDLRIFLKFNTHDMNNIAVMFHNNHNIAHYKDFTIKREL
jgi:hypothetical protein